MNTHYFISVAACSALLFAFYLLAYRNRSLHGWNRSFLLVSVIASLLLPLVRIDILFDNLSSKDSGFQMLRVIAKQGNVHEDLPTVSSTSSAGIPLFTMLYWLISCAVFIYFISGLVSLWLRHRQCPKNRMDAYTLISTQAKGSPFSFLKTIYWNDQIELGSAAGQRILAHELAHVRKRHSLDQLFFQLVLTVFWFNPIFWLMRKELALVHEFETDKAAVGEEGAPALAEMILTAAFAKNTSLLVSPFLSRNLARRLRAITGAHSRKKSWTSHLLLLPFCCALLLAFSVRARSSVSVMPLSRSLTVVIDAGHGYQDGRASGARFEELAEDDINLELAKTLSLLNTDPKLKLILTRTDDQNVDLHQRVEKAKAAGADVFISLHTNVTVASAKEKESGFEVVVSGRNEEFKKGSEKLGSAIRQQLSSIHKTFPELVKKETGIYVLDKNICPAVLIECGYIDNATDRALLNSEEGRRKIASAVLSGLAVYAGNQ